MKFLKSILFAAVAAEQSFKVTKEAVFDVTIGGSSVGEIVIGLFGDDLPKTVDNFCQLSDGVEGVGGYEG
jgi:peptidyl-prolyl cis-trans isomerase B (cyclophilin B)